MTPYQRLISNHPLANIAFAVVLVMGVLAYLSMPREQDPEINFNWLVVTAALPGAGAEDVERKVVQPLEDALARIQDIRFISSSSRDGVASILVRFRDIGAREFDKRVQDLRREVQAAADRELPREATTPVVWEITTSNGFPTAMLLIEGNAFDEPLRAAARAVMQDLERMPGIDQVVPIGLADPELRLTYRPEALAARGLTPVDLADSVARWFQDTPAGRARVGEQEWLLRVLGQHADPGHLAGLTVFSGRGDRHLPLAEVAEVSREREKPDRLVSHLGQPAVLLSINKRSQVNTLDLVARIQSYIDNRNPAFAERGIRLSLLDDQTVATRQAIGVMQRNALQGLALVLLLTWLFLGSRLALLVSVGIPFSLAGTFWALHGLDFTLNLTVLLGVIIALGMLVDDAVVILEDMYYRMTRGTPALQAASDAVKSVGLPVLAAVLTTIAAFLPLMLLPGIVGKFMFVVPLVVTLGLLASLLQAYWILPAHVCLIRPDFARPSRLHGWRTRFNHALRLKYSRLLIRIMRWPRLSLAVMALAFLLALHAVLGGWVKQQFFAFDPLRLFYVSLDMPPGTAIDVTLRETERLERAVLKHVDASELRASASYAGIKFTDTEPLYGDAYGQVVVSLAPREGDMRSSDVLVAAMREAIESMHWPGAVSFIVLSGGPPTARPIKARLRGDDYDELRRAADRLRELAAAIPGIRDIVDDDLPGRQEYALRVNVEAVRALGLDPAWVARMVRLAGDGEIVAEMRHQGEKVEVRVRGPETPWTDIDQLLEIPVALPGGGNTRLGALVEAEARVAKGLIRHYDLRRAITVEADLDKSITDTLAANERLRAAWATEAARFPGVSIDYSGELDDIQESLDAMGRLFLLGIGLIYLILATQFRSYWQPMLILATVPMAFTGVTAGLLVSGNPLSLYTLYGVIALTGIAVNSAIVLIDAANARLRAGMGVLHAAIYAGRRRVVPVLITTFTTIGGLISLALGLGGKSLLWGPVASAIVWGLMVSTALTLFLVPLLYRLFMRQRAAGVKPGYGVE